MPTLDLILLVDDDETTNYVNKRLLTSLNVAKEIKIMTNGQEALTYLQNAAAGGREINPDLIFLDIKMPVMDGFTFLEAYERQELGNDKPIIIMMLTSSASFYDLERLKSFKKVKKHISKALTNADVREILQEYFEG
ncbi:response regulator [Adhaeribacter aerolatus]|uniref:Response regulator n=1 Tax=Adhaeribacter aerolatus TaxID=670289 RepID=A0A512ATZ6_9BACT|nr:response regulator [Adhaeribacter aerolatus]GEO03178.1 response regulator [Adhaeribacter aerolatus]